MCCPLRWGGSLLQVRHSGSEDGGSCGSLRHRASAHHENVRFGLALTVAALKATAARMSALNALVSMLAP